MCAVGESADYGNYIIIEHQNGISTLYAHLDNILLKTGDEVKRGDTIGKMGDTGNASSVCLHFELTQDGVYLNPEYYLRAQ